MAKSKKTGRKPASRGHKPVAKHGMTPVNDALPTAQDADDEGLVWLITGLGDGADARRVPFGDVAAHVDKPNKFWARPDSWDPPKPE